MTLTRISHARTRPPSMPGSSLWQTIPRRLSATLARICVCCEGGKTSRMRLRVLAASLVCMVPITKCPVSAALTAISIVSRSRISPITMMSGSSRSAPFERGEKRARVVPELALSDIASLCRLHHLDRITRQL